MKTSKFWVIIPTETLKKVQMNAEQAGISTFDLAARAIHAYLKTLDLQAEYYPMYPNVNFKGLTPPKTHKGAKQKNG